MIYVSCLSKLGIDDVLHRTIMSDEDMKLVCDMYHTSNATFLLSLLEFDVLLFDVDGLSFRDVIQTVEKLREKSPDTKIAVLISRQPDQDLSPLLTAKINSILEKNHTLSTSINRLVHDILNKHYIIPHEMTKLFISDFFEIKMQNLNLFAERLSNTGLNLSKRQIRIAYLLRIGLRNREIAAKLRLSEGTIKGHVSRIYQKMGSNQREKVSRMLDEIYLGTSQSHDLHMNI